MKTKRFFRAVLTVCAFTLLYLLSGCVSAEAERNLANFAKLRKGMDKKQVLAIMGEPVKGEAYCSDDVWYYFTNSRWMDGLITRDECTPVAFDYFGKVIGWGPDYNTGVYDYRTEKE